MDIVLIRIMLDKADNDFMYVYVLGRCKLPWWVLLRDPIWRRRHSCSVRSIARIRLCACSSVNHNLKSSLIGVSWLNLVRGRTTWTISLANIGNLEKSLRDAATMIRAWGRTTFCRLFSNSWLNFSSPYFGHTMSIIIVQQHSRSKDSDSFSTSSITAGSKISRNFPSTSFSSDLAMLVFGAIRRLQFHQKHIHTRFISIKQSFPNILSRFPHPFTMLRRIAT